MIYADKKDGKLTGRWRVEVQRNGQRARGRFDTMEEARAAEQRWMVEFPLVAKPRVDKRGAPKTLGDLVDRLGDIPWRGKESRDITESRLASMVAEIGKDVRIEQLTTETLDACVSLLLKRGLKNSTINKYLSALHVILREGSRRRWVDVIPAFPWLDEDEGRIRWITESEELQLLRLLPSDVAILVKVAIVTGMRRSELLTLQREQVEDGWVHLWKTKTKTPRSVPINSRTHEDLLFLIDSPMPSEHVLRYQWEKAREAMGLADDPWFTFHVTRHTCATRLVKANVNLRIIQKWLGHKRIETTIRYAQVSDQMLQGAHSQMENFLTGNGMSAPTNSLVANR